MTSKTTTFSSNWRAIYQFFSYYWFPIFWFVLWVSLFCKTFWDYYTAEEFRDLRQILGISLPLGRGSAAPLAVSCFVAPLAVCRALHPLLARLHPCLLHAGLRHAKQAHYAAAAGIVLGAVIHTSSHIVNAMRFSENFDSKYGELNWARFKGENPLSLALRSWAGATGLIMILSLLVVSCTSLRFVRRSCHAAFWFAHQIAAPLLLVLLLLHPLSGVLKKQRYPVLEYQNRTTTTTMEYVPIESMGWIWPAMGLLLCILDTLWRYFGTYDPVQIVNTTCLPGGAVELTLLANRGPEFTPKPGQYVLLRCPTLSWIEYHPFTIARCPSSSEKPFSLIISQQGDWTRALYKKVENHNRWMKQFDRNKKMMFSMVGPFNSPLEQLMRCKVAVCIAAGVGITPFSAVINELISNRNPYRPYRVHLIWIIREISQLNWLAEKLNTLHEKFWHANQPDRFQIRLHVTREETEVDAFSLKHTAYPVLERRCYKGKPNWSEIFSELLMVYQRNPVYIFSCGPKLLNHTIKDYCKKFNKEGSNLHFVQETF